MKHEEFLRGIHLLKPIPCTSLGLQQSKASLYVRLAIDCSPFERSRHLDVRLP